VGKASSRPTARKKRGTIKVPTTKKGGNEKKKRLQITKERRSRREKREETGSAKTVRKAALESREDTKKEDLKARPLCLHDPNWAPHNGIDEKPVVSGKRKVLRERDN